MNGIFGRLENFEATWASKHPLRVVIGGSSSRITFPTASVFDKANYGLRSLILDSLFRPTAQNANVFQWLRATGFIDPTCTAEEIYPWLRASVTKGQLMSEPQFRQKTEIFLCNSRTR